MTSYVAADVPAANQGVRIEAGSSPGMLIHSGCHGELLCELEACCAALCQATRCMQIGHEKLQHMVACQILLHGTSQISSAV